MNHAEYLDVKVNKWESNSEWSGKGEPFVRIGIFRNCQLADFVREGELSAPSDFQPKVILTMELDCGGSEIDVALFRSLVCVVMRCGVGYRWRGSWEAVDAISISSCLPSLRDLQEAVVKGDTSFR